MTITIPNRSFLISAVYLVLLSTVFVQFTVEGKNFVFITFSILGWGVLTLLYSKSFPRHVDIFLTAILLFMVFASIFNYRDAQWISLVYSVFFIISYFFYSNFISVEATEEDYSRLLKFIFMLYFMGLLAGQLYLNFWGFSPLFATGNMVHGKMGVALEDGQYRFYSFSSEPSYAAFIAITLFYGIVRLSKNRFLFRESNLLFFLMLLYMLFFFRSVYAALLLGSLLISFLGFKKRALLAYGLVFFLGLLILTFLEDIPGASRIIRIVNYLDIENPHTLASIDFSAYYRLAPLLHYFRIFDWQDIHYWIGHGPAASRHFVVPETYLASQGEFLGGFIPSFFFDYGVLGAVLVLIFIFRQLPGILSVPTVIVILMLFNANFNTQLFWFVVTILSLTEFYKRKSHALNSPTYS